MSYPSSVGEVLAGVVVIDQFLTGVHTQAHDEGSLYLSYVYLRAQADTNVFYNIRSQYLNKYKYYSGINSKSQ